MGKYTKSNFSLFKGKCHLLAYPLIFTFATLFLHFFAPLELEIKDFLSPMSDSTYVAVFGPANWSLRAEESYMGEGHMFLHTQKNQAFWKRDGV